MTCYSYTTVRIYCRLSRFLQHYVCFSGNLCSDKSTMCTVRPRYLYPVNVSSTICSRVITFSFRISYTHDEFLSPRKRLLWDNDVNNVDFPQYNRELPYFLRTRTRRYGFNFLEKINALFIFKFQLIRLTIKIKTVFKYYIYTNQIQQIIVH